MKGPWLWTASTTFSGHIRKKNSVRATYAYPLPAGNLLLTPNPRDIIKPTSSRSDECDFCDQERSGDARALLVVLDEQLGRDVLRIGAKASERCEDDAVRELHVANLDRREESRGGIGSRRHLSDGLLVRGYEVC